MPKTQVKCPQCQQPAAVNLEQLFDVSTDQQAKQRLLSGASNYVNCPVCGYSGLIATPIVYHDNDKELLLSFFPPELSIPLNEQEKIIGPLINQIVDKLPSERRKAYLFSPKSFLTYQSMLETILGADGITPEMIKAQQGKANLIEKLLSANSEDAQKSIINNEQSLIDAEFFALFARLMESAVGSKQEEIFKKMESLQQILIQETEFGQQLATQNNEIQEAVKTLQAAGKGLTREKLIEILLEAPNDTRLSVLVSYTRQGLDYQFFQLITDMIDKSEPGKKEILESLRSKLLDITKEYDQHLEVEVKKSSGLINEIISSENIKEALSKNLHEVNETFIQLVSNSAKQASNNQDKELIQKYNQLLEALQEYSAPPPEYAFLQELLEAPDNKDLEELCIKNSKKITPEFTQLLSGIIAKTESDIENEVDAQEKDAIEKIQNIYKLVLRISMKNNLEAS